MAYPQTRPNGMPLATELTANVRAWLCRGGLDPDRVMALGVPAETLVLLWNVRVDARECDPTVPTPVPHPES